LTAARMMSSREIVPHGARRAVGSASVSGGVGAAA